MNREILFRGKTLKPVTLNKHIVAEVGQWIYGGIVEHIGGTYILMPDSGYGYISIEVIPETVSQYTGLTDKNGKKIFEGDIVRNILILENNTFNENIDIVEFNKEDCSFMLGKGKRHFNKNLELEVIGNIFDEKE